MIGPDRRIVEWDASAARLLGLPACAAQGVDCGQAVGGVDDFGRSVCGPACPAARALAGGSIAGTSQMLVRTADGAKQRVACELLALPSGGALGRLRNTADVGSDLAHDLAGIAALTEQVAAAPLQEGLCLALDYLLHATIADASEVFLADPHGRGLVRTCHRGRFGQAFDQLLHFDPGEGFPGLALALGQPVYTDHLRNDARFLRSQVKRRGFNSYICAPLLIRGVPLGCAALAFRRTDVDHARVVELLRWVGTPLGLVIETALTNQQEVAGATLRGIAGDLRHRLPRALLREMIRVARADGGELYLAEPQSEANRVLPSRAAVPRCPALAADDGGQCPCFRSGVTRILRGCRNDWPGACRSAPHPGGAWSCIPLVGDGGTIGIVRLLHRHLRPTPPNQNIALLERLATLAAERIRDALVLTTVTPAQAPTVTAPPRRPGAEAFAVAADVPGIDPDPVGVAAGAAPLQIRCFGALELSVAGKPVLPETVRRKRTLELLGILLTHHDRPLGRNALIDLLWPGADPEVRKRQFHVLVHDLRKLLEPEARGGWQYLRKHGDRYVFSTRSPCWVDVVQFRHQIGLGRNAEAHGDHRAAVGFYEAAAGLYRGDYLQDGPSGEWCWLLRERLRQSCLELLVRLADLWGAFGRWDHSVAWSRHALQIDPLREDLHRTLMYALWATGRRDEAVRQYGVCARLLRECLSLAPQPVTDRLLARIRAVPRPEPGD